MRLWGDMQNGGRKIVFRRGGQILRQRDEDFNTLFLLTSHDDLSAVEHTYIQQSFTARSASKLKVEESEPLHLSCSLLVDLSYCEISLFRGVYLYRKEDFLFV